MSDPALIETLDNDWPNSTFEVTLICDEFTCLCPYTGKPDFATLTIIYSPDKYLIEMMSLKEFLTSFSNEKIFQENAINKICNELVKALKPKKIQVKGEFSGRGGVRLIPVAYG